MTLNSEKCLHPFFSHTQNINRSVTLIVTNLENLKYDIFLSLICWVFFILCWLKLTTSLWNLVEVLVPWMKYCISNYLCPEPCFVYVLLLVNLINALFKFWVHTVSINKGKIWRRIFVYPSTHPHYHFQLPNTTPWIQA